MRTRNFKNVYFLIAIAVLLFIGLTLCVFGGKDIKTDGLSWHLFAGFMLCAIYLFSVSFYDTRRLYRILYSITHFLWVSSCIIYVNIFRNIALFSITLIFLLLEVIIIFLIGKSFPKSVLLIDKREFKERAQGDLKEYVEINMWAVAQSVLSIVPGFLCIQTRNRVEDIIIVAAFWLIVVVFYYLKYRRNKKVYKTVNIKNFLAEQSLILIGTVLFLLQELFWDVEFKPLSMVLLLYTWFYMIYMNFDRQLFINKIKSIQEK